MHQRRRRNNRTVATATTTTTATTPAADVDTAVGSIAENHPHDHNTAADHKSTRITTSSSRTIAYGQTTTTTASSWLVQHPQHPPQPGRRRSNRKRRRRKPGSVWSCWYGKVSNTMASQILVALLVFVFAVLWLRMFWRIGAHSRSRSLASSSPFLSPNNTGSTTLPLHQSRRTSTTIATTKKKNGELVMDHDNDETEGQQELIVALNDVDNDDEDEVEITTEKKTQNSNNDTAFQLLAPEAPACHPLGSPEEIAITLVTQLSSDRLWMLAQHCARWGSPHPISIAVYIPTTTTTLSSRDEVRKELRQLGCRVGSVTTVNSRNDNNGVNIETKDDGEIRIDSTTSSSSDSNTASTGAVVSVMVLHEESATTLGRTTNAASSSSSSHENNNNINNHNHNHHDYPVNELRNLALRTVRTTHILYIDVDFWTSQNLYDTILPKTTMSDNDGSTTTTSTAENDDTEMDVRQQLYQDPKLALVIPAFQLRRTTNCTNENIDCRAQHVPLMPHTLHDLANLMMVPTTVKINRTSSATTTTSTTATRGADIFDPYNYGGHGSTDYQYWFQQLQLQLQLQLQQRTESTTRTTRKNKQKKNVLRVIPCLKSQRYEPFVIVRYCREVLPPFQTRFTGYGKNKMTWMMQLARSGFVFSQVQYVYLIHYPHAVSSSRKQWNHAPPELVVKGKQQPQPQHNTKTTTDTTTDTPDDTPNYNIRRPKRSEKDKLHLEQYKRGQIDQLYVEFKQWLDTAIPAEQSRIHLCEDAQDDDSKLWIAP